MIEKTVNYTWQYSGISHNRELIKRLEDNNIKWAKKLIGKTLNGGVVTDVYIKGNEVTITGAWKT